MAVFIAKSVLNCDYIEFDLGHHKWAWLTKIQVQNILFCYFWLKEEIEMTGRLEKPYDN